MTAEHMASCQNKKPCAPEQQKTVPTEIVTCSLSNSVTYVKIVATFILIKFFYFFIKHLSPIVAYI